MSSVKLLGGWGYHNLGDEAILAGYLETLRDDFQLIVCSKDADRTGSAQRLAVEVRSEGRPDEGRIANGVLCGGGYLNGSWVPEIALKLRRLQRERERCDNFCVHSVEVRNLASSPIASSLRATFANAAVGVRDETSADEVFRLSGVEATPLPDAISLLTPHLHRYVQPVPELRGKVLLNLLDIRKRPDRGEFELPLDEFHPFVEALVERLGDRAVGLIIGDGDLKYLRSLPAMPLIAPTTVSQLVSSLQAVDAVVSVRMHPALLSTALGTPVLAVPYCGKVSATLRQIGVDSAVLRHLDADRVMDELTAGVDHSAAWADAHALSSQWLLDHLKN